MDLRRQLEMFWRYRMVVILGAAIGLIVAFLVAYAPGWKGGPSLERRGAETWSSSSRIFVTQVGFPWGRVTLPGSGPIDAIEAAKAAQREAGGVEFADPGRFSSLALLYANLAESDRVRRLLPERPTADQIQAQAVDATGNGMQYLPVIALTTTAATARGAVQLNLHTRNGLEALLREEQDSNDIPQKDRVQLSMLDEPSAPLLVQGPSWTPSILALFACLAVTLVLVRLLEGAAGKFTRLSAVGDAARRRARRGASAGAVADSGADAVATPRRVDEFDDFAGVIRHDVRVTLYDPDPVVVAGGANGDGVHTNGDGHGAGQARNGGHRMLAAHALGGGHGTIAGRDVATHGRVGAQANGARARGGSDVSAPNGRSIDGVAGDDHRIGPIPPRVQRAERRSPNGTPWTPSRQPTVDAIVLVRDVAPMLRECVAPLAAMEQVAVTVVADPDHVAALGAVADLPVHRLRNMRGHGFWTAVELSAAQGTAENVLLMDPDARFGEDDIAALIDVFDTDPSIGIVAPKVVDADGRLTYRLRHHVRRRYSLERALARWSPASEPPSETSSNGAHPKPFAGACLLIRRQALEDLTRRGSAEGDVPDYTELCNRVRTAGWNVHYEPRASVKALRTRRQPDPVG